MITAAERTGNKTGIDRNALKWIASFFMLIDHFAYAVLYRVYIYNGISAAQWTDSLYHIMRKAGRIAFPLYIFMLVDGFYYTRSRKRYLGRLMLFSLISEIPFDIALKGTLQTKPLFFLEYSSQNVFFTLAFGFAAMWITEGILAAYRRRKDCPDLAGWKKNMSGLLSAAGILLTVGAAAYAALLLKTDYKFYGVLAIVAAYMLRPLGSKTVEMAAIALVLTLGQALYLVPKTGLSSYLANGNWSEIFALLAVPVIIFYNGKKGRSSRFSKWFFYFFYPAHLLVLGLLAGLLMI